MRLLHALSLVALLLCYLTERIQASDARPKPAAEVDFTAIDSSKVLLTVHEGMPSHERWLQQGEALPPETLRWHSDEFLLDRLPQRFDSWGIRAEWGRPVLLRFAAKIHLSPGKHQFLIRVRGLSRLWVNGQPIAESTPHSRSSNGEEPITPVTPSILPGMRLAEHRQQELVAEASIGEDGVCRVLLETIVGGKSLRTDPGETCVAVKSADKPMFFLLRPDGLKPVPLQNGPVLRQLERIEQALTDFDDERRRKAAESQDEFWARRHRLARKWIKEHPGPAVPDDHKKPIDAFIDAKIEGARSPRAGVHAEKANGVHTTALQILRDNCFRCHAKKSRGGLSLASRQSALKGGDSGLAAIVPGEPQESELIRRITSPEEYERMPPDDPLTEDEIKSLESWVLSGADWPTAPSVSNEIEKAGLTTDIDFLRRVYLDTVGVIPDEESVRSFLSDSSPDKRARVIDELLGDDRFADHWMPYWLDVLAENPTLLNKILNSTGPFRWFLYDSLRDNKSFDRIVTELILMRGSAHEGGSAGFALAGNNPAPKAAKAQIVAGAFLGLELKCARCHDSPFHSTTQRDLYSLAAMLERKAVEVPEENSVPEAFFTSMSRESLIEVTLRPGEDVKPAWPFEELTGVSNDHTLDTLTHDPHDTRERLAALITAPQNARFAQVIVNRIWRRFLGAGIVEPPDDWEGATPSHPELLEWLAREFVRNDYDLKHVSRLILTSETYQREALGNNRSAQPELRFFQAPDIRRMTAEQLIDSLHAAVGVDIISEELTFDPDARRLSSERLTLGVPERAWMFASLNNERDRPSLTLPKARAVTDVLKAFGWKGARQNPFTDRENAPTVLQPGVMANSLLSVHLLRASRGSELASLAVQATSPDKLVERLFLRFLSRLPSDVERKQLATELSTGFNNRLADDAAAALAEAEPLEPLPTLTWSNHARPEANGIALELERRAADGPPPDPRLKKEWRMAYEDVVWCIANLSEFVWIP